jgi:hypothetical protein
LRGAGAWCRPQAAPQGAPFGGESIMSQIEKTENSENSENFDHINDHLPKSRPGLKTALAVIVLIVAVAAVVHFRT